MIALGTLSLLIMLAALFTTTTYMGWRLIYFFTTTLKYRLFHSYRPMAMRMSNPNEKLMLTFGMGVVLAWVVIAATASYFSSRTT